MFLHSASVVEVTTFVLVALICMSSSAPEATRGLPHEEVQALMDIGNKLRKKWNFDVDPCGGWTTSSAEENTDLVNCSCTSNVCHVDSILLNRQSLAGVLPVELVKLPFLKIFDVSLNYLSGTIPPEWGLMRSIQHISISGNRLNGSIPKELGNLSTLESLEVDMNRLSGPLPSELRKLTLIKKLDFRSNNFTEELPSSFAELVTLKELYLGDNNFTGRIPEFIHNFKNLEKLVIQASGLQGPIPDGIEHLRNLTYLKISDLNGPAKRFPQLSCLKIRYLMLRNCNLSGNLPEYLANMTLLKTLDVSFNNLSGRIIPSIDSQNLQFLFLTRNQLSGSLRRWISREDVYIDFSYNNFTFEDSLCSHRRVNLFASSSMRSTSGAIPCLIKQCPMSYYNLYINCGGGEVTIGGKKYDDDSDVGKPSTFFSNTKYHWGYSSTGYFDGNESIKKYIWSNVTELSIKNPLYKNARLSPISLTYYAFCLKKGSYTLSLHFAEIMFTNDKKYSSLGRRIFDVYIQGNRELKDLDIAAKAGGVGKEHVENFRVMVTDGTLEIRFHWAGKGTTAIPYKGVYGPLISAISLEPNFKYRKEMSTGVVVSIIVALVCFVFLAMGILWWQGYLRHNDTMEQDLKDLDLKTCSFTLRQIKAATNNFDPTNKIGEGGFGSVYKGLLVDGTIIAVKQLSSKSKQGNREFINEIGLISALQHPHLVKLYGCCIEGNNLLLVYEYMENNSLAHALFGLEEHQLKLDWPTRHRICVGIARGLAYLHEESRLKIVHRDIKATNVLLDKDLVPKISDFGLARLTGEDNTHISTRIAGTFGYMAPEYAMRGYLTDKADVYSFGIVALEIICGKSSTSSKSKSECFYLLDWANVLKEKGDLIDLVDPRLGSKFNKEEAMMMINIALLCTNVSPVVRPSMSSVVSMLEGKIKVDAPPSHATITIDETKLATMRKHFNGATSEKESKNVNQSIPMDGPQTSSSTSAYDLYPLNLSSDYLLHRD